ncbi:MAG: zinc-binding dehydrogenase [Pseudomonadales bacterium]|jgi:threonine dehydrogenase-like Zn-dependent dehydrogenase|nr:zinc-binding dehydrogenase [Pseudomonadales bacterium]
MRAVVMRAGQLLLEQVPDPVPTAGEVVVRSLACGICGSDLHALKHTHEMVAAAGPLSFDAERDVVMGHEFCGEVMERTGRFAAGTRVTSVPMTRHGDAVASVGYSNDVPGAYGEYLLLTEQMLLPVPNGLATDHAALTEPMAVGLHAVEMSRLTPEDVPLVIGCGPVGLAVIAALKLKGAGPVVAADFSPARRALAEACGADVVIDPAEHSPYARWEALAALSARGERLPEHPLTGEPTLRPGVFFECVGIPGVIDQMMVGAQRGCRFVVVGVCMQDDVIRPLLGITKELNLQFVLGYTPEEFAATLEHIAQGRIDVSRLVTGHVGLAGVADAFETLASPAHHCKIVVEPWTEHVA